MTSTKNVAAREPFVHEWFWAVAAKHSQATAIESGDIQVTYQRLSDECDAWSRRLSQFGSPRGSIVGIFSADCQLTVASLLGTLCAGHAFCSLDPALPDSRLVFLLKDAEPRVVCTSLEHLDRLESLKRSGGCEFEIVTGESIEITDDPGTKVERRSDDLCYLFYTSGSSGIPKGIAGRLRGIDHFIRWEMDALQITRGARVSQLISHSFDASLRDIFLPLCSGGTLCVPPSRGTIMSGEHLAEWLDAAKVEIVHCVPSLFRTILPYVKRSNQFPALRCVLLSGEALWAADVKVWRGVLGDRVQLINLYGPSETTMTKFFHVIGPVDIDGKNIPIGRPIPGCKAIVVDVNQRPCPTGAVGEIYIRTPYRTLGYWKRPDLTAEVFVPNPFAKDPQDIVYRTGDLARVRADGELEFIGRIDGQVKILGQRVEPGEVEAIAAQYPAIRECVVVAPAEAKNQLVAYCTQNQESGVDLDLEAFKNYLRQHLPAYMVPAVCVLMPELPLTPNGKIDRRALADISQIQMAETPSPPRNPEEEAIASIWAELLKIGSIGVHDNFFARGGHSLLATQVISRIRSLFGVNLSLTSLFENPTIAGIASRVRGSYHDGREPVQPISASVQQDALPLSFAQQRLWFLEQLNVANAAYHMSFAFRITGPLRKNILRKCIHEIVRRHAILRTTFSAPDGQPLQQVNDDINIDLKETDLRNLDQDKQDAVSAELTKIEAERLFDLAHGPLVRLSLFQYADNEYLLAVTMHHIVSDGWSAGIVANELSLLYRAYARGEESPLPPLAVQYKDFAIWQRQITQMQAVQLQEQYWRQHLVDLQPLELPTDCPRPLVRTSHGERLGFSLPANLIHELRNLGREEGATLFMTLLGVFEILLSRYSGQSDFAVGTAIANRNCLETERLVGCFANTLVLRSDLAGRPTFRELLRRVRQTCLDAYKNQDVQFEKLVDEFAGPRDLSRNPLFQVMFLLQNMPLGVLKIEDLRLRIVPLEHAQAKFDLTVALIETPDGIRANCEYSTDLFVETTMHRLMTHYRAVLQEIVSQPDIDVNELDVLDDIERRQLIEGWNRTAVVYRDSYVHESVSVQASLNPAAIAVSQRERQIDYGNLERSANQLAHHLQSLGVRAETIVGVCLPRTPEMIVALLAILKAGGAYLPLDSEYPQSRLAYMLNDARASVVITFEHLHPLLPAGYYKRVYLDGANNLSNCPFTPPQISIEPDQLAYLIYTSGSTGNPKAVAISHRAFSNYVSWSSSEYGLTGSGGGSPVHTRLTFDLTVTSIFPALVSGKQLHLVDETESLETERKYSAPYNLIKLTPSHLSLLHAQRDLARVLVVGGEALYHDDVRPWIGQGTRVVNEYGPTETTVGSCIFDAGLFQPNQGAVAIGKPIANTRLYVLNDTMKLVPVGVIGELYIAGAGLARGYLNRPSLTADKFVPDPFGADGNRLYRTGDRVRYGRDGNLEFIGRLDDQVKLRGFRIELAEIDAVLRGNSDVAAAATLIKSTETGKQLVAYVVPGPGIQLSPANVRRYCQKHLPDYMIPTHVVLVDRLEINAHGKLDRSKLPDPLPAYEDRWVAPRTHDEQVLCLIYAEILKQDRIGVTGNFFEYGGHSLLATQVTSRIQKAFGVDLPVRTIFESPTVAELAVRIRESLSDGATTPSISLDINKDIELERLVAKLEDLPESEVERLLQAQQNN